MLKASKQFYLVHYCLGQKPIHGDGYDPFLPVSYKGPGSKIYSSLLIPLLRHQSTPVGLNVFTILVAQSFYDIYCFYPTFDKHRLTLETVPLKVTSSPVTQNCPFNQNSLSFLSIYSNTLLISPLTSSIPAY
jgi:hypothetical protein